MFEHLDDPSPPDLADDDFRAIVHRRGRRLRRRRRAVRGGALTVSCSLLVVGVLYANAVRQVGGIERLDVAGTRDAGSGLPMTVLIVGVDEEVPGGESGGGRSDTLIVVRVEADNTVSTLTIPRDLAVEHPDSGDLVRINHLAPALGLSALVAVVESQLHIPVDHLVQIDFGGFVRLVDLLGGIDVHVSAPIRDQATGLALEGPGCVHLDGRSALALARARRLSVRTPTGWRTDTRGDLDRIDRQPVLLTAALGALGGPRPDPLTANRLAGWLIDNVAIDDALSRADLADLARAAISDERGALTVHALPVDEAVLDGGAAVLVPAAGSGEAIQRFMAGAAREDADADAADAPVLAACE